MFSYDMSGIVISNYLILSPIFIVFIIRFIMKSKKLKFLNFVVLQGK